MKLLSNGVLQGSIPLPSVEQEPNIHSGEVLRHLMFANTLDAVLLK